MRRKGALAVDNLRRIAANLHTLPRKTRPQEARTESLPQRRVLVLHGPNLNLFSSRDPISGEQLTLADIHAAMESRARADGVQLESFQATTRAS